MPDHSRELNLGRYLPSFGRADGDDTGQGR